MLTKTRKVVIVGTGFVGSSAAYSILNQGICDELILIDVNKERSIGEAMDLSHCADFLNTRVRVIAGTYEECSDADLVVITAGAAQKPGQTRLELLQVNMKIMKEIITNIMESGFDGLFLVASNPVDVISYIVWKLSGFSKNRVIGTGTSLDSSRLKFFLSEHLDIDPRSILGFTLGEHGDSQFVPWSLVTVEGKPLLELMEENNEKYKHLDLEKIEEKVKKAAYEIINRKGSTYYGIGAAISSLLHSIFNNDCRIRVVSTLLEGEYNEYGLFTSVPTIVTSKGVKNIIELKLTDKERQKFTYSNSVLRKSIESLTF